MTKRPVIPEAPLHSIVPAGTKARVLSRASVDGNVSPYELSVIGKVIAEFKPRKLFEIGTFDGRTTLNMAANSPANAKVYTIDLPKGGTAKTALPTYESRRMSDTPYIRMKDTGSRFRNSGLKRKIVQLYGDSATFDFRRLYNSMDFVFVDGSHSRHYVKNDTEVAFKLLKRCGIIMWHDYGFWKDVTAVLDSYFEKDRRFRGAVRISGTVFVFLRISKQARSPLQRSPL